MKYAMAVLMLAQAALVCPRGCYDFEGICACDAPSAEKVTPVVPDNAKPRKGVQPEWETGEVKTINAPIKQHMDDAPDAIPAITK